MIESDGSLQLELVREGGCVGALKIDATRRAVRWDVAPGQIACADGFEAPFDDVIAVSTHRNGGFVVQFKSNQPGPLALVPSPHGARFAHENCGVPRRRNPAGGAGVEELRDGAPAGPPTGSPRRRNPVARETAAIDAQQVADSRRAVDSILAMLGRPASPRVALRDALYGPPAEATLALLLETPARYVGKAVRLRGRFEAAAVAARYQLADGERSLALAPEADLAAFVQSRAEAWIGHEVELVGVLWQGERSDAGSTGYRVSFWSCAPTEIAATSTAAEPTAIAALFADPQASVGKVVRLIGRFRGRNLFGDLPRESSRLGGDWVVKDGPHALWVIGRAVGAGFDLDPGAPSSTAAWVDVVGEVVVRDRRLMLRAQAVALVPPPPAGRVVPPRQAVGEGVPPAIIFTLPLEGEAVAPEGRLVIQFSKPMDEESFAGRVRLRYAGGSDEEDFHVGMRYDDEHRALVIDPGTSLRVGATLEVRLLPGIVDAHGMALEPRAGRQIEAAVDALRYPVEDP